MGKKSKKLAKKRSALEAKARKREELKNVINPFETRINKVKHNALGRRVAKNERGKPLVSRGRALQKRKETLLSEYKRKDKTGKGLVDNRLKGSLGSGVELRKAQLWKMKSDVLLDDIKLTHKGMDINEVKFEDNYSDLDDGDDDLDLLKRGDYVESAHFGGGEDGRPKSSKEFMDEVMDEKRKRQIEKEENFQLTEKLDKDWQQVKSLLSHKKSKVEEQEKEKNEYDILVRELMFTSQERARIAVSSKTEDQEMKNPQSKIENFMDNLSSLLEEEDPSAVFEKLQKLFTVEDLTEEPANKLKRMLEELPANKLGLRTLSLLSVCNCLRQLRTRVRFTIVMHLKSFRFGSLKCLAKMLLLADLLIGTTQDSYVPELVQFLQNCFVVCCGRQHPHLYVPCSKLAKNKNISLVTETDFSKVSHSCTEPAQICVADVFGETPKKLNKDSVMLLLLSVVEKSAEAYKKFPSYPEMFRGIKQILRNLAGICSPSVKPAVDRVDNLLGQKEPKTPLFRERPRPVMLPMLEPKIIPLHRSSTKDERKKLTKKVKREFKGAQRELRRDAAFMKDTWLKETMAKDKERREKTNKLMSELALERGLYKRRK